MPERIWQVIACACLAAVLTWSTLLRPLDFAIWAAQAKLPFIEASGDVVMADASGVLGRAPTRENYRALAEKLGQLSDAGAKTIMVDSPLLPQENDIDPTEIEEDFRRANVDPVFVQRTVEQIGGQRMHRSDPVVETSGTIASIFFRNTFLGFVWDVYPHDPANPAPTASVFDYFQDASHRKFVLLDYAVDTSTIQVVDLTELNNSDVSFANKIVIVFHDADISADVWVPGKRQESSSYILALTAETLTRNAGHYFPWAALLLMFGAAIAIAALPPRPYRIAAYWTVVAAGVAAVPILSALGYQTYFLTHLILLASYGTTRGYLRLRRRNWLSDAKSGLPNYVAMQRDWNTIRRMNVGGIAVMRMNRLDETMDHLSADLRGTYVKAVADRVRFGSMEETVYFDGGKELAFYYARMRKGEVIGHLDALRTMANAAVEIDGRPLDVSITVGAAPMEPAGMEATRNKALAALQSASEAYHPCVLAGFDDAARTEFDPSLQARVDKALDDGQMSIRIQPQMSIADGVVRSAEVLVRWFDPERGEIAPSWFVAQCEKIGRLDELTRFVLQSTIEFLASVPPAHRVPLSVNISAVQLVDRRIERMLLPLLAIHRVEPSMITLEITETARISDFIKAASVMSELRNQGFRLSIDDFGVESANLEALLHLPFDELKIDRLFVQRLGSEPRAVAVVRNAVSLAHDLGLTVVAEGVERSADLADLVAGRVRRRSRVRDIYAPRSERLRQTIFAGNGRGRAAPSRLTLYERTELIYVLLTLTGKETYYGSFRMGLAFQLRLKTVIKQSWAPRRGSPIFFES